MKGIAPTRRRRPLRRSVALLLLVGAVLTGCGRAPATYGPGTEAAFVLACAPDQAPSRTAVCRCAYRWLRDHQPYAAFVSDDAGVRHHPDDTPAAARAAVDACTQPSDSTAS